MLAAQGIAKYAGFVVVDHADAASAYPLLTLRQNIYTDPQKPIQVQPGLYELNNPKPTSPVLISTNFSITYFSVANEVEGSGLPAWLLIADADGMSVLTAWAAGKFDADKIAKTVAVTGIADKVERKLIVIPGHTAVLLGELEEALKGWDIRVGPREAVDLPAFMKTVCRYAREAKTDFRSLRDFGSLVPSLRGSAHEGASISGLLSLQDDNKAFRSGPAA